mgnify:CR=1 FL=1
MLDMPKPLKRACVAKLAWPKVKPKNNKIEAIFIGIANLPYPIHKPEFSLTKLTFKPF